MSATYTQLALATTWVTELVRNVAVSSKVGVISLYWRREDNLYILEIAGEGSKRVSKLFEASELSLYPLEGTKLQIFEWQLIRLLGYFKKR